MRYFPSSLLIPALACSMTLAACANTSRVPDNASASLHIAATVYPLAEVARVIGGPNAQVVQLTPAGIEPHDYEPTPRDIARIEDADMLLLNGGGIDRWAEELALARGSGHSLMFFDLIEPLFAESEADPHAWLDPVRMKVLALALGTSFARLDPAHADGYRSRAQAYAALLDELDGAMRDGLRACDAREIVVAHDAFRYLGARYDLVIHAIAGLSPEEEPAPARLAEVTRLVREKHISVIFFETLASPKLAHTIARETGASTAVLNPLEGLTQEDIAQGKDYVSVMRENVSALRSALACR